METSAVKREVCFIPLYWTTSNQCNDSVSGEDSQTASLSKVKNSIKAKASIKLYSHYSFSISKTYF